MSAAGAPRRRPGFLPPSLWALHPLYAAEVHLFCAQLSVGALGGGAAAGAAGARVPRGAVVADPDLPDGCGDDEYLAALDHALQHTPRGFVRGGGNRRVALAQAGGLQTVLKRLGGFAQVMQQGAQFGIVNINLGQTAHPEVERTILDEVGSYGKQLGHIGDALEVLLRHVKLQGLSRAEEGAIDILKGELAQVRAIKAKVLGKKSE